VRATAERVTFGPKPPGFAKNPHGMAIAVAVAAMQRPSSRRGFTFAELAMIVGLLVVGSASVMFVSRTSLAHEQTSPENLAEPFVRALSHWQQAHPNECPTMGLLESAGYVEVGTNRDDAWGSSFRVACDDDQLRIVSPGPDNKLGTKDDVYFSPHQ
jgi:hypothetical protein